jgi:hypothetical protein
MKNGPVLPSVLAAALVAISPMANAQQSNPTQLAALDSTNSATNSAPVNPVPSASGQTGQQPHLFQVVSGWAKLPATPAFGPTHGGVAVDSAGNVYVSTDSPGGIFVFSRDGTFLRTIAPTFSGIHSLVINQEGGTEYLYGVQIRKVRAFKMSLDGNPIVMYPFPKAAGIYPQNAGGYQPAGIVVAPDLSVFVSDGYGSNYIHKYSPQGQYIGSFGGPGSDIGKFNGCIGLALDTRVDPPVLLVCDCNNNRVQKFDLNGNYLGILAKNLAKPASAAVFGQSVAIAEHDGRVTIFDQGGSTVVSLGENPNPVQWGDFRLPSSSWIDGVFIAPHGIAWDKATGSLYVEEWSLPGRIIKLDPVR